MRKQVQRAGLLGRDDWDFDAVPEDERFPCTYWEYARESARIRAFFAAGDSEFFPVPPMQPEIRSPDRTVLMPARRSQIDPPRMRFAENIWTYALPLRATAEKARDAGLTGDHLHYPWQQLPLPVRRAVVVELAPYFAEHPALTYLPFHRCSDLRDIHLADEQYRCAELDVETGIERLRVEISWGDFTDKQIIRAFRIWLKENRPRGFGQADRRGKRKSAGFGSYLVWLGILRLMHFHPFTSISHEMREAWTFIAARIGHAPGNRLHSYSIIYSPFFLRVIHPSIGKQPGGVADSWAQNRYEFLPISNPRNIQHNQE